MKNPSNCPKCEGAMVQGFIPDFIHHSINGVCGWHEGQPQASFWKGTKAKLAEGMPIGAFRCNKCGYLELYAGKEFAAA
jgi:hypothetical protein